MNKIKTPLLIYLIVCSVSAMAVALFAFIQYHLILGDPFQTINYFIPVFVGLIFGLLLSRNIILRKKLKNERDLVYQKNKRIRSFTGTIVHDLKNPVSAIHGFSGIMLEQGENLAVDILPFLKKRDS